MMLKDTYKQGMLAALIKHAQQPDWLPGKFKQRERPIDDIDRELEDSTWAMQPKIDGVGVAVNLREGERPVVFTAEPKKTGPREHTGKIPVFEGLKVPKALNDTIVRSELFGRRRDSGKPIPARNIVGMVNASTEQSLATQKRMNAELVPALLTVVKYQGKDMTNAPYKKQRHILEAIQKRLPQFVLPDQATTRKDKLKMLNTIKAKRHPLTQEGVVFHNLERGKARPTVSTTKAKFRPDFDIFVRNIFPGKGSRKGKAAGGFEYSWTPRGPIVGRVGTGFTHSLVRDMYRNPTKYIGRVAKVRAQGVFPGKGSAELGALRTPSFREWHLEKGK